MRKFFNWVLTKRENELAHWRTVRRRFCIKIGQRSQNGFVYVRYGPERIFVGAPINSERTICENLLTRLLVFATKRRKTIFSPRVKFYVGADKL